MLAGKSFYILPSGISTAQLKILTKVIKENGSLVIIKYSDNFQEGMIENDEKSNAIMLAKNISSAQNISKPVYDIEWLSQSIVAKKLLDKANFQLNASSEHKNENAHKNIKKRPTASSSESENSDSESGYNSASNGAHLDPQYRNATYACQQRTPLKHFNQNLISQLQIIQRQRAAMGNAPSELSYTKAISALKAYPRDLESAEEAEQIRNIGPKISSMIKQYFQKGTIDEVATIIKDPMNQALDMFTKIYGVGPQTALQWYRRGYKTLSDVDISTIPHAQQIGLKYYDELNTPMDRETLENAKKEVDTVLNGLSPNYNNELVGGYRRGKTENGDIDLLVWPKCDAENDISVNDLSAALQEKGLVTDILQSVHGQSKILKASGPSKAERLDKCFCIFQSSGKDRTHRRLDIVFTTEAQYPFSLLGWTGSRQFERSIRHYAKSQKRCKLSSQGLFDTLKQKWIDCKSEKAIFDYLDLEYIEPEYRNC